MNRVFREYSRRFSRYAAPEKLFPFLAVDSSGELCYLGKDMNS